MRPRCLPVLALLTALLSGCSGSGSGSAPTEVSMWSHGGTPEERAALTASIEAFNTSHPGSRVLLRLLPEGTYNDVLETALAAGNPPDIIDLDGPTIAGFAARGALSPLEDLLPDKLLRNLIPSVKAEAAWNGHLWALGTFDSGLALFADRRALRAAGVVAPISLQTAWTGSQFRSVLQRLSRRDPDRKVLDLKRNYGIGEWLTYGFAPLLSSAGGGVLDPTTGLASGTLDSPASVRALTTLQSWTQYVDPNTDDRAFTSRRVALSWVGHWAYPAYAKALGDDLLVLPFPDLGNGAKTGQGSWTWAVSRASRHADTAAQVLTWLGSDAQVAAMTQANGAVPGTMTSLAASALHRPGGPLSLYAEQLAATCAGRVPTRACVAVPRPITPEYAIVTEALASAIDGVLSGRDPTKELAVAARTIDAHIQR